MAFDAHSNFAYSTVATAPSPAASGTTLTVTSGQGARFPAAPFNCTVWATGAQPTVDNAEIIRVTSKGTGDDWTIVRAQEGSTARSIVVGDQIAATITSKTLTDVENSGVVAQGIASTFISNVVMSAGNLMSVATGGATDAGSLQFVNVLSSATTASSVTSANAVGAMASRFALEGHQHAGVGPAGLSNIGNTAGDTGTLQGRIVFAGGNNITLSGSSSANNAQTITISAFNQTVQTQNLVAISASDALFSSGTVTMTGVGGGATINTAVGKIQISVAAPVAQTNQSAIKAFGVSNTGQTAGNSGVSTGIDWVMAGSQSITLSQSTAAGGPNTVWVQHPAWLTTAAQSTQTLAFSLSGNTATTNSSQITAGGYALAGGANITLQQSNNTISISAPAPGAGGGATLDMFVNWDLGVETTVGFNTSVLTGRTASVILQPLMGNYDPFPGNITANTVYLKMSMSGSAAAMSAANTTSVFVGIYTQNISTLSLLNSVVTTWGNVANLNNSTISAGLRWLTIHSSAWSAQPTFSGGHYYWGVMLRTSGQTVATAALLGNTIWGTASATDSGTIGVATVASATSRGMAPWYGVYSAATSSLPTAIGSGELNKQTDVAIFNPLIMMLRTGPQTF